MSDIKKRKGIGGRKKLSPEDLLNIKLQIHISKRENELLEEELTQSGYKSMSMYLRNRLFSKKLKNINKVKVLENLDKLGGDLNRIGNNINQVAHYANRLTKQGIRDVEVINQFNMHFDEYLKLRRELVKAYRAIME